MELSQESIHDVIHPTAAFSGPPPSHNLNLEAQSAQSVGWQDSLLNPKNRIDSLSPLERPLWRIDGCTAFGSQLYAVPLFIDPMPPIRMDVFIPEPSKLSPDIRNVLDVDVAFHTTSAKRIAHLGITQHVLRILQYWTSHQQDPTEIFTNIPFGSRIVFKNLPMNVAAAEVIIARTHYLERQLLSVSSLEKAWGSDVQLPPTVNLDGVVYVSQLHDSVCLVKIEGKTWIFKALTSYTKYLYHELRQLLTIQPHPNIVSRPVHLVTKKCGFGSKVAVIGFTLEYHIHGSLRDLIPFLKLHNMVSLADETKWAIQLASALVHLRATSSIFYPDLRLDNIVLSAARDAIMVDFEQRGVWCEFAAPEVNALEYVRLLAIDEEIPAEVSEKYSNLLTEMLPEWQTMGETEEYKWPSEGYNVPWACLTPKEQEACEVYMLGRVLWCIFEGNSAPQRAAVWLSYRWEPLVEFPGYTKTPGAMQRLINRCTRGRQAGLSRLIVRERNQLVLRELEKTGLSTADDVQRIAKKWWSREIDASEQWLRQRIEGMKRGDWRENYYDRPTLKEVLAELETFRDEAGFMF
ncbi:Ff.00g094070.m01.CDS01 [Fusarium sp. VM40]|nr:Ff.00g094070.m01.CDS01 [Fusarium sp. VM40]